jgi:phosphoglucomutase
VDVPLLLSAFRTEAPDPSNPAQAVSFGTSGHRGSSLSRTFNEAHIAAISQAICVYRKERGIEGPLFLAKDTHALSGPAFEVALEVLAANGVEVLVDASLGFTPTPALSHAILRWNRGRFSRLADGIVITPSHNPPEDGGFKYNPPDGGPADTDATSRIEGLANGILAGAGERVRRTPYRSALSAPGTGRYDFVEGYVSTLGEALDLEAVRNARVRIGADPMGGAVLPYLAPIAERYSLDLAVVNDRVDPTFSFMPRDWDGKIRMDCSSPHAMANLIALGGRFDVAFGNDTDGDRHGIVTGTSGLMNPNHYLAAAADYLFRSRPGWKAGAALGKTLVSSSILDRVAARLGRPLLEVPVGFKWFVPGLSDGTVAFGGEESAGASFLCRDGSPWSTDKDGILLGLLAAEITAVTGKSPAERYGEIERELGAPSYRRVDARATARQKGVLKGLSPADVTARELGGEAIESVLSKAPGNGAPIGGIKVTTRNAWFAARPSGTEDVYKVYAESFLGPDHLDRVIEEAQALVSRAFAAAGA